MGPRRADAGRGLVQRNQLVRCPSRSGRRAPCGAAPRAAAASSRDRGSARTPCAGGAPCSPRGTCTSSPPSRRTRSQRVLARCGTSPSRSPSATAGTPAPGRRESRSCFSHSASVQHVVVGRARVRGDEVRDQVLLLAGLSRVPVEQLLEPVVGADARLQHLGQRPALRCARARSSGSRRRGGSPARCTYSGDVAARS